jgi:hypothetical protein
MIHKGGHDGEEMKEMFALLIVCWLFLAAVCVVAEKKVASTDVSEWQKSTHLEKWYQPLDLCLLSDRRNVSIDVIVKDCLAKIPKEGPPIQPVRCRVGNTWPSRSAYCDPEDIPLADREHLLSSIPGLDDPSANPLRDFVRILSKRKGLLLMIGDSVMQQFYSALACELEREGIWDDPAKFTNTDETRTVALPSSNTSRPEDVATDASATLQFLPIYHLVNGRYDRVPQAALHHLRNALKQALSKYRTIVILINMGLHYVDNPVAGFSKDDYAQQMTTVLTTLHQTVIDHPDHTIKVLWRETTAQHFPTPNGYWPGVKYATHMRLQCTAIQDGSPQADWRNRAIEQIIVQHNLFSVQIVRFYNITLPLWSAHPNGRLRDCTHFCWFPMLYQSIFHRLREVVLPWETPKPNNAIKASRSDVHQAHRPDSTVVPLAVTV